MAELTIVFHQVPVGSAVGNPAVIDEVYPVAIFNSAQAMGDNDDGAVPFQQINLLHHIFFGKIIER
jgi:hypothetical protein